MKLLATNHREKEIHKRKFTIDINCAILKIIAMSLNRYNHSRKLISYTVYTFIHTYTIIHIHGQTENKKRRSRRRYSCPRDRRGGPNWGHPWNPSYHYSTIVLRGSSGPLIGPPIGPMWVFFILPNRWPWYIP